MVNVQLLSTAELMVQYRELMLQFGADRTNKELSRKSDVYEEEILRRMAW